MKMKKKGSFFRIIALLAALGFALAACSSDSEGSQTTVIYIAAIQGVTVPFTGRTPVTTITENEQYSGTVTWSPNHSIFATDTQYRATIRLTAKTGYTLQGVGANFFTVAGAVTVNNTNSGVITAVFPVTVSIGSSSTRSVTIDMYDSVGDGWDGGGALRININGVDIADNVKVQSGSTNTYTFNVTAGDVVRLYWVSGSYQEENSFIVYYTDTPPSPAFTANNNDYWNGSNALVYKLRGTMDSTSGGTLLGSFTVPYINNDEDTVIDLAAIQGVIAPVSGRTPVTTITENEQYSGTVTWSPNHSTFAAATVYTASITLSPKTGYTMQGVEANFFTVAGATSVRNSVNSGVVTAVFPVTVSTGSSSTRSVTIDMYDSVGDGWDGGGALRINVNGVDIASNVKVQSGSTNTYTFNVTIGDVVRLYWVSGSYQSENSFIVYYTDTPPSPAFTASNNNSWNGSNALVYKLRGTMDSTSGGTLLGSFTAQNENGGGNTVISIFAIQGVTAPVTGGTPVTAITENEQYSGTVTWNNNPSTFAAATQYTATIRLTAKTGYTLQGVAANFFTVTGATSVSNSANSGVVTAVFPATAPLPVINIAAIQGVTAPVIGGTPVTTITENAQYSGTVTWSPNHSTFAAATQYTATIRLTVKTGYNLQGVAANFFTVAGATSVSNSANSGVITALFPQTNVLTPDSRIEYYWVDKHGSLVTTSGGVITVAPGATLTITAQSTGYTARQWYLNGVNTGQSGNTYNFFSTTTGKHIVSLFVEKDGKLYNTNITITVAVTSNGSETNPFLLTAGTWENSSITSSTSGNAVWYSFNVISGTTYRVWWNDSYQGNSTKTLDIKVDAKYSNGTAIFTGIDSAYTSAQSFTANQTGTVKLKVYPYSSGSTGTFGIVYSTSSTRP